MTENFATSVIIAEDVTGPSGLVAGPFLVNSIGFLLGREAITNLQRRDFWRAITTTVPILSQYQIGWEFDFGDSDVPEAIFDALADPERGTEASGVRTWKLGRPDDVRRFDFIIDPVEGGHFEARECAIASAQFVFERGRIATCLTRWVARFLTTDDSAPTATNADNTTFAAAPTVEVEIDGLPARVFSGALDLSRTIEPAQFDANGRASQWTGRQTVDVLGRLACRFSEEEFANLVTGEVIESEMVIRITAGTRVREISMSTVRMEVGERTFVGEGTYEHLIQFAVVRSEGQEIATITSQDE